MYFKGLRSWLKIDTSNGGRKLLILVGALEWRQEKEVLISI